MFDASALASAIGLLADPWTMTLLVLGIVLGLIIGILPGLGPPIAIALALPFTFYMDTVLSMVLLLGIYSAAIYGGSISAILINTPGTAAAVCTALDGHPMARRGRAQEALHKILEEFLRVTAYKSEKQSSKLKFVRRRRARLSACRSKKATLCARAT